MSSTLGRIVVIGGGVGGCCTALELAEAGFTVDVIEKEQDLMKCTSNVTPGRMGLGFHYQHVETALFYLRATVRFARDFGHFRIAKEKPLNHPLRRGRYFILKCSKEPPEETLKTYEAIKQEYAKLIAEDPRNKVFGSSENLFKLLDQKEFENDVPVDIVKYGVETAEEFLDWVAFRTQLIEKIDRKARLGQIKVHLGTEVTQICQLRDGMYCIDCVHHTRRGSFCQHFSLSTNRLVNSAWQNIAALNTTANLTAKPRLNRVKAIATIELPPEIKYMHSMFFCMGPFCMFCNKGDGTGVITYAPVTNIGFFTTDRMPPELEHIMNNMTGDEKIRIYGKAILEGVSLYIPKLASAKILKVETGIVQTYLTSDHCEYDFVLGDNCFIHDPSSSAGIHQRNYSGVEKLAPGFVVNSCMKLLYCMDNAKVVRKIFTKNKNQRLPKQK